jgi:hypothetical protein
MELEVSLPFFQGPSIGPYPELDESNPNHYWISLKISQVNLYNLYSQISPADPVNWI